MTAESGSRFNNLFSILAGTLSVSRQLQGDATLPAEAAHALAGISPHWCTDQPAAHSFIASFQASPSDNSPKYRNLREIPGEQRIACPDVAFIQPGKPNAGAST